MIGFPDTCIQNSIYYDKYTLYFYGSPDYKDMVTKKFTLQKNGFNEKIIQGMLNIFKILSENFF